MVEVCYRNIYGYLSDTVLSSVINRSTRHTPFFLPLDLCPYCSFYLECSSHTLTLLCIPRTPHLPYSGLSSNGTLSGKPFLDILFQMTPSLHPHPWSRLCFSPYNILLSYCFLNSLPFIKFKVPYYCKPHHYFMYYYKSKTYSQLNHGMLSIRTHSE